MTPEEIVDRIAQFSGRAGFTTTDEVIGEASVVVARTSQFRLRWFATRLHTYLVARAFPSDMATPKHLDEFMRSAMRYGKTNKRGLPVGLQTAVAAISVAVTDNADNAAHRWASSPHGQQVGMLSFPVMVDVATGEVTYPPRRLVGGVYSAYLIEIVDKHVTAAVGGRCP